MIQTINGDPARPLGLAAYPKQPTRCVGVAFDAGVNYFFFYGPSGTSVIDGVAGLVDRHRGDLLIGCGSGSRRPEGLERILRRFERAVGTDVIDVFFAEYLNTGDDLASVFGEDGVIATLACWRDAGRIRYVGATTHDVSVARSCVTDKRIDVLMLRYNMAHRRLASAVFPHARQASQTVVAFTATRWSTLLRGHPEWTLTPPTALECYRYCLADPAVDVVLTGATTIPQLRANLPALQTRALGARERRRWEAYGDLVYGTGTGKFETAWP